MSKSNRFDVAGWIKTAQTVHGIVKDAKQEYDKMKENQQQGQGVGSGAGSSQIPSSTSESGLYPQLHTSTQHQSTSTAVAYNPSVSLESTSVSSQQQNSEPAVQMINVGNLGQTAPDSTAAQPQTRERDTSKSTSPPMPVAKPATTGSLFGQVSKTFVDFVLLAKERILGEDFWIPSDATEAVAFPVQQLAAHQKLFPENESISTGSGPESAFAIYAGHYKRLNEPTYHVTFVFNADDTSKVLSIFRSQDYMEATDIYQGCLHCAELFLLLDNAANIKKDVRAVLLKIKEHPLWFAVHIAANMGTVVYFRRKQAESEENLQKLINIASHPEGNYPLQIAIANSHLNLVTELLAMGASPAKTDIAGWNALHYAAMYNAQLVELLASQPNSAELVNALNSDGCTPLFLAIRAGNARCMMALMRQGAELNVRCKGRSPLHEAMQQKDVQVIKTLVEASASEEGLIDDCDPQSGNTPLHAAVNKRPLGALLAIAGNRLDINATNYAKQTALHLHTYRLDLGCVMTLAAYGIDLDAQDADGNTALHIAVVRQNLDLVRALLVLGADVSVRNHNRDTPRHLAAKLASAARVEFVRSLAIMGAERCSADKVGCAYGCAFKRTSSGNAVVSAAARASSPASQLQHQITAPSQMASALDRIDSPPSTRDSTPTRGQKEDGSPVHENTHPALQFNKFRHEQSLAHTKHLVRNGEERLIAILSLDGGGIRGLILLQLLLELERLCGGERILDYFDWVAGTSTGSFVGTAMCQDQVFEGWQRPYNTDRLEMFIKQEMGETSTMADIEWPRLAVTTCRADYVPCEFEMMRNYRLPATDEINNKLGFKLPSEERIWKVLRKSSAAPTYFTSVDKQYIDGGMIANNPTIDLMCEVEQYNSIMACSNHPDRCVRIGCVLSVGCGRIPDVQMDTLDFDITGNPLNTALAVKNLGFMLIEQVTATEGVPVERARTWANQQLTPFYRFSTPMSRLIMLDTKDDVDVLSLMWDTVEYIHSHRERMSECVQLLMQMGKSERRRHYFEHFTPLIGAESK